MTLHRRMAEESTEWDESGAVCPKPGPEAKTCTAGHSSLPYLVSV